MNETRVSVFRQVQNEGYGRIFQVKYPNYAQDPSPRILALGFWDHPTTGNRLLGGLNLNYLDEDEIEEVREALPLILRRKELPVRYRVGRRLLPDIFAHAYRTYRADFIRSISPDSLKFGTDRDIQKAKVEPDMDKLRELDIRATKEKEEDDEKIEKLEKEPEPTERGFEKAKLLAAYQKKRELEREKMEKRRREELERLEQRRKEAEERRKAQLRKREGKPTEPLYGESLERDCKIIKDLGPVWRSTRAYRYWHSPNRYLSNRNLHKEDKSLLAVFDVITKTTLIDHTDYHANILLEAGWNFDHTIRLSAVDGRINYLHDDLELGNIEKLIPPIVVQALISV